MNINHNSLEPYLGSLDIHESILADDNDGIPSICALKTTFFGLF